MGTFILLSMFSNFKLRGGFAFLELRTRRSKGDRLALWIKNSDDNEKVMEIGAKFVVALDLAKQKDLQIEFHPHSKVLTSVSHGSKSRSNNALNGLSDIDMNQMKKRIGELSQA
ncbi:hypothetical protein MIR68_002568 [Amoeboaphelidium protococcarum]|nr:hypothetical protein MIR68_002568 [Amoeboaphelidium protococcarum]